VETRRISERAEHETLVAIRNAVIPDDPVDVEDHLGVLRSCREHESLLVLDGDRAIGAAVVVLESQRETPFLHLWVAPAERRRGAGSALYGAVSAWAAARGRRELEVPVRDDDLESLEFAKRRGFAPFRSEQGLVLTLESLVPPPVDPPSDVDIVTWAERPDLARGLYEVAVEALPDIPGEEESTIEPFDDWLEHEMRGPGDRPEATFVALAGDGEVVGYAKFSLTQAQPTTAHHDLTAVKRAWRGRGIAGTLKARQIVWAKENGFEELRTRNERRNEPIRRLNARFGYRPSPGRIYLRGPVSLSGSGP
jgi:GNAT superfamily N-acetyltransferase